MIRTSSSHRITLSEITDAALFDHFVFWEIMPDGTAEACTDDDRVNANPSRFYGNIEGAIIHGGVRATAFDRRTEEVFDTAEFFKTGRMVSAGSITHTKITAQRD